VTDEEEKKKLSPLAIAAGAIGSVLSMLVGSLFGDSGTIYGAALSSVTCSVGAFWFEDRTRRAHARLKARKERGKVPGTQAQEHLADLPLERSIADMRTREHLRRDWGLGRKLGVALGMLGLCLGSAAVTLVGVEKATGKTLSSVTGTVVGRQAQYGTTLGGYSTHSPSPVPSLTVTPSGSVTFVSPSATISASPDTSPDASPDLAPSTPSPSPDLTPSSLAPLPSGQVP
jgi:hypothetical protein